MYMDINLNEKSTCTCVMNLIQYIEIYHLLKIFNISCAYGTFKGHGLETFITIFKDDVQKTKIYCYLCAMMQAKSELDFNKYKEALVSKLGTDNPGFLKYLSDHYFNRQEKCSLCFRKVWWHISTPHLSDHYVDLSDMSTCQIFFVDLSLIHLFKNSS